MVRRKQAVELALAPYQYLPIIVIVGFPVNYIKMVHLHRRITRHHIRPIFAVIIILLDMERNEYK